ncbi:MAG: glycoside hydrolase family 88 protein [Pirellulaceae bacterium]|nr:glycoside hydrolase family 88 protein [Pirellulaceae bacterium]
MAHRRLSLRESSAAAASADPTQLDATPSLALATFAERKATIVLAALLTLVCAAGTAVAEESAARSIAARLERSGVLVAGVGTSRDGLPIEAVLDRRGLDHGHAQVHVLLVGQGAAAAERIGEALQWFHSQEAAAARREKFVLSAVPDARPGKSRREPAAFPPAGKAYQDPGTGESMYLWRWLGIRAPDLVVEVEPGDGGPVWYAPEMNHPALEQLARTLGARPVARLDELAAALASRPACDVGTIPALRVASGEPFCERLLQALSDAGFRGPSPARREIQRRVARSPIELAGQLSRHYGRDLNQVVYIPALALVGRLRLGELTGDNSQLDDVLRIVGPYLDGSRPTDINSGSAMSGHLVFSELAERTAGERRQRFVELVRRGADVAFERDGQARPIMPFHNEMSDALFMGGPILAHAGRLTGDARYYDACQAQLRAIRALVLRPDGLYRHSPLDEAAWGRGNGFPALGLAWCLTCWPDDRGDRAKLLDMFRTHLEALRRWQDESGCWHQVIDRPETYRELTCTAMITLAMARGVRLGWLSSDDFRPAIDKGWYAVRTRVAADGQLVDVCTGTGKQPSLADYYLREAILGRDARGGAMALMVATEMAELMK